MASISTSRTTAHLSTTITVVVNGVGTAWTPGTPGTPTFTLSGGTGASISGQVVNSATKATLTIVTGTGLGLLTITDPSTGSTATIDVVRATHGQFVPQIFSRRFRGM